MGAWPGKCLSLGDGCSSYCFSIASEVVSQFPHRGGEDYTRCGAILLLAPRRLPCWGPTVRPGPPWALGPRAGGLQCAPIPWLNMVC